MIFFKYAGRGMLVPVYVGVSVVGIAILAKLLEEYVGGIFALRYSLHIVLGIGLLVSGLWNHLTSQDYITVNGKKQEIYLNNHLFYLPLKMWSYILFYGGALTLLGGILETLEANGFF